MDDESLSKMAEAYYLEGKLKEAIAACQQAIRVNPNFAPAYNTLGNILQANSQIEAAMRAYSRSLQLSPNFFPAWANLGSLQDRQGYLDEAVASYERAIAIAPQEAGVWEDLGKLRCARGDLEEAISCFRQLSWLPGPAIEPHAGRPSRRQYQRLVFSFQTCWPRRQ